MPPTPNEPGDRPEPPREPPQLARGRSAAEADMRARLGRIAGIGTDFAVAVAACGFVGWLIDYWRGTQPWFLLGGLLLGLVVGFYRFVREALAATREPPRRR